MPSKDLQTRDGQKARYLMQAETRKAALKEQGFSDDLIKKDVQIKHFKAKIKQINSAIARINFIDEQNRRLKERKDQRLAEEAQRKADEISGVIKPKEKKKEEEKAPPGKKKGGAAGGKAQAKGKTEPKKKK